MDGLNFHHFGLTVCHPDDGFPYRHSQGYTKGA
jgi:hypothetical protein